jgi:hypothetical protein
LLPPLHVKTAMARLLGALVLPRIIFPAAGTILAAGTAVCKSDIDKHCAAVQAGEGRIVECLKKQGDKLSMRCRQAIDEGYRTRLNPIGAAMGGQRATRRRAARRSESDRSSALPTPRGARLTT